MEAAVFWFNIFCFSLMFGAVGLSYILYRKQHDAYRMLYIIYLLLTAFWFVLLTYLYFITQFMESPSNALVLSVAWIRIGISVMIAYVVQLLFSALLCDRVSVKTRLLALIIPAVVLSSALTWTVFGVSWMATAVTFLYNFGLGAGMLALWMYLRRQPRYARVKSMGSFLVISGVAYLFFGLFAAFFVVTGISTASVPHMFIIETGLTGLFIFVWCFNDVLVFMRLFSESLGKNHDVPDHFVRDYQISKREADILRLLVEGKSGKEIGDILCISPRTVETHTYNIYRKCSVSNRIELLNLISLTRSPV